MGTHKLLAILRGNMIIVHWELGVHYSQTIRQILLIPLKAVKELKKRGLPFGNSEKQDSWVFNPWVWE